MNKRRNANYFVFIFFPLSILLIFLYMLSILSSLGCPTMASHQFFQTMLLLVFVFSSWFSFIIFWWSNAGREKKRENLKCSSFRDVASLDFASFSFCRCTPYFGEVFSWQWQSFWQQDQIQTQTYIVVRRRMKEREFSVCYWLDIDFAMNLSIYLSSKTMNQNYQL